jgi:hypothetical protein
MLLPEIGPLHWMIGAQAPWLDIGAGQLCYVSASLAQSGHGFLDVYF